MAFGVVSLAQRAQKAQRRLNEAVSGAFERRKSSGVA